MDSCYLADLFDIYYIYKCGLCVPIITVPAVDYVGLFDYYRVFMLDKMGYLTNKNLQKDSDDDSSSDG